MSKKIGLAGVLSLQLALLPVETQAAQYCGTVNGQAVIQELAGRTCAEAMESARSAGTSHKNSDVNQKNLQQTLEHIQNKYSTKLGPIETEEAQEPPPVKSEAENAFSSAESAFEGDDWSSRATAKQNNECDCSKTTGSCTGNISISKSAKTGSDFIVESSEPYCSKVSYYIDNTPYITILKTSNTSFEHSASLKPLTLKNFKIQKCEICSK